MQLRKILFLKMICGSNDEEMFKLVLACEKALDKRFPWAVFGNQKTVGKLVDDLLEYLKLT